MSDLERKETMKKILAAQERIEREFREQQELRYRKTWREILDHKHKVQMADYWKLIKRSESLKPCVFLFLFWNSENSNPLVSGSSFMVIKFNRIAIGTLNVLLKEFP